MGGQLPGVGLQRVYAPGEGVETGLDGIDAQ